MTGKSAERQLDRFIGRYTPEIGALARAALARMRVLLPGAVELVYANYDEVAIGFGPTDSGKLTIFSIALYPRQVVLFFMHGADLPDPQKLLKGGGSPARHLVLDDEAKLDKPAVRALIAHALERASKAPDGTRPGRIVIKHPSARQRPPRPR